MAPIERAAMKIRKRRMELGMTQEQLATKVGVSREYIVRLEAARHDPTLSVLERIAKALRIDIAKLLK
jgi:predicted transcriptional regulator